jgi:hypothetical protein
MRIVGGSALATSACVASVRGKSTPSSKPLANGKPALAPVDMPLELSG